MEGRVTENLLSCGCVKEIFLHIKGSQDLFEILHKKLLGWFCSFGGRFG